MKTYANSRLLGPLTTACIDGATKLLQVQPTPTIRYVAVMAGLAEKWSGSCKENGQCKRKRSTHKTFPLASAELFMRRTRSQRLLFEAPWSEHAKYCKKDKTAMSTLPMPSTFVLTLKTAIYTRDEGTAAHMSTSLPHSASAVSLPTFSPLVGGVAPPIGRPTTTVLPSSGERGCPA